MKFERQKVVYKVSQLNDQSYEQADEKNRESDDCAAGIDSLFRIYICLDLDDIP